MPDVNRNCTDGAMKARLQDGHAARLEASAEHRLVLAHQCEAREGGQLRGSFRPRRSVV
jgi:hypothetical protein